MRVWSEGETVIKAAETEDERSRLAREADVLRRVAHPGVVRLVSADLDQLTLARVPGPTLVERGPESAAAVASWAASLATIVGDLHDVGWTHGNLRPEHVLFDDGDRPVLCGFSRAERAAWGQPGGRGSDLRAVDEDMLVRLITDQVADADTGVQRAVARWQRRRRGGLRGLAREISKHAQDPNPMRPTGLPARRPGWSVPVFTGAFVAAGVVALVASAAWSDHPRPRATTPVPAYLLQSGDGTAISAIGDWTCGSARLAVLDPTSGQVWVFPSAPGPGNRVSGLLAGRVSGATGLSAEVDRAGCDRLTVLRGAERGVPMPISADG